MLIREISRKVPECTIMDRADLRVIEAEVKAAVERCEDAGVEMNEEQARTMLAAERQLGELGVTCDLIGRLIELTVRKNALLEAGMIVE